MQQVFDWAERQTERFRVDSEEGTIHLVEQSTEVDMNLWIARYDPRGRELRTGSKNQVYVGRNREIGKQYACHEYALRNTEPLDLSFPEEREPNVRRYAQRLWAKMQAKDPATMIALNHLLTIHDECGKLTLVCHCLAPTVDIEGHYCHAQVIARALIWLRGQKEIS